MDEVMDIFDALSDEQRRLFEEDIEELVGGPEELSRELWHVLQAVDGFCTVAEVLGPVALLVMSDTRERVRLAREMVEGGGD